MSIFVQIASYRDPELIPTLKSCLENAKNPEEIFFGICKQYHPEDTFDDLSEYENDSRIKIINVLYNEAKGVCWARNQVQQLYNGEDYTLQIDSHMRFEKNWDETLVNMIIDLQNKGYKKPLLTSYVSSYNPQNDPEGRVTSPWRMVFDRFIPEGAVFFLPEVIPNWESMTEPIPARFYSAHFCFTLGKFSKEVQHNPDFYFHGEEISIAVRAYTHGYDLFHPHKVIIWHEYTRNGRTKHWDDDKEWWKLNEKAHSLNRQLFAMDGNVRSGHEGKYGFGKERTLRDYEKYAGLLFEKRGVQKYTLEKNYPPNPQVYETEQEWIKSFSTPFKHCINLHKTLLKHDDYNFWAVIFSDENGKELFRKDCDKNELTGYLKSNNDLMNIWREFDSITKPSEWIVWAHSEKSGWAERITGKI
jgi:glycosyltransferase involved in cell wall biosynthesis